MKTNDLYVGKLGTLKKTPTGEYVEDIDIFTGGKFHREIHEYEFIPYEPICFVCVRKEEYSDNKFRNVLNNAVYEKSNFFSQNGDMIVGSLKPLQFEKTRVSKRYIRKNIMELNHMAREAYDEELKNKKNMKKLLNSDKDYIECLKVYVENIKVMAGTDKEEAKKEAIKVLMATGMIDENGNLKDSETDISTDDKKGKVLVKD